MIKYISALFLENVDPRLLPKTINYDKIHPNFIINWKIRYTFITKIDHFDLRKKTPPGNKMWTFFTKKSGRYIYVACILIMF